MFTRLGKHLEASVLHHSGRVIVTASTRESCYRDLELPAADTEAAVNLATILARRCLESGVLFVHVDASEVDGSGKTKAFYEQLRSEGLKLVENECIMSRRRRDL